MLVKKKTFHISQETQFHARSVNGTLLSKATIKAGITDVARGHLARRRKVARECKRTSRPQVAVIVF